MNRFIIFVMSLFFAFSAVFAQNEQKIAVYVVGELGANEKKAFSTKMLSSFVGSGKYKAIDNTEAFFNGLQDYEKKSALENNQIIAFGKQLGAQFVCLINVLPAFGSYHVSANIIDTETSAVVIIGEAGSALKSLDDLTNVSNELATQLLQIQSNEPTPVAAGVLPAGVAAAAVPVAAAAAEPQTCDKKYNINELLAQIQYGFPSQLNDCGSSLVKAIAMSKVPFSKTPAPEPKSYMTSCTMDGIKGRLPDGFPGLDKAIDDTQKFLQTVLNTALAGGPPNPASLMKAASDIDGLLNSIKSLKSGACIVDEPYEYVEPVKETPESSGGDEGGKKEDKTFTFGIRTGMNFPHFYATYNDGIRSSDGTYESAIGFQAGFVFDFAISEIFHLQPGLMYLRKGSTSDDRSFYVRTDNIEIPLLVSLKLTVLRINLGPYFNICLDSDDSYGFNDNDVGISSGLGFDIGWFYIGTFYEYGLTSVKSTRYMEHYNRTLGFNLGINL